MIKEELKSIFTMEYIKSYFTRNRNLAFLAIIIFISSIIVGYIFSNLLYNIMLEALKNMNIPMDTPFDATLSLFFNNIRVNLLIILLGFTFSVLSVLILFINGVLIGFVSNILPVSKVLLYTIPHGIFEIPALIIAVVTSFIVTKFEIRILKGIFQSNKTFKGELYKSGILIKDIILGIVLVSVLLVIAAVIEANLTVAIGDFVSGLL